MTDRLGEYRRKRDPKRTPEPIPAGHPGETARNRFVIQQHHARSLHWDVRLERDGVLVSFAVPRGLPRDRTRNNLAKHTEDHPLEYLDFAGEIPAGEYGGGRHHPDAVSRAMRHCAEHPEHRSSLLPPTLCRQRDNFLPLHPMLFAVDDDPGPPPLAG